MEFSPFIPTNGYLDLLMSPQGAFHWKEEANAFPMIPQPPTEVLVVSSCVSESVGSLSLYEGGS